MFCKGVVSGGPSFARKTRSAVAGMASRMGDTRQTQDLTSLSIDVPGVDGRTGDEVLRAGGLRLVGGGQHGPPLGGLFGFAPELVKPDDPRQGLMLLFLRRVGVIP